MFFLWLVLTHTKFKGHSTLSASTSKVALKCLVLSNILAKGQRPRKTYFAKSYNTSIEDLDVFSFSVWRYKKIKVRFKGCVRYIFTSLFCISKREHSWNKEKKIIFILKIITFSDIQMSWRHQMLKHETRNTYYWITWEVNSVW